MHVRAVNPARSRIVLVGVPQYGDQSLPDIPVIANNLTDLAEVLTDPNLGGFAAEHCVIAPVGAGVAEVGDLLAEAAEQAEDLLLFYYAGHGMLTARRFELHLSLAGTRPDRLPFTALPTAAVRDAFLDSRATNRVVILDSCFSGRVTGETLSPTEDRVLGQLDVTGSYTLASAPANGTALVLPGERHTAFTERLIQLLRAGSPEAGPMLSMGEIYRQLRRRLHADGLPLPTQRGTDTADLLGLIRNVQGKQAKEVVDDSGVTVYFTPVEPEPQRVIRRFPDPGALLDRGLAVLDLTVAATAVVPNAVVESGNLASMAALAAPHDLSHARWLTQHAERAATRIADLEVRGRALATLIRETGAIAPERTSPLAQEARRCTETMHDDYSMKSNLADLAGAIAASAIDLAEQFADDLAGTDAEAADWARQRIVAAIVDDKPEHAELLAGQITENESKLQALTKLAGRWAGKDAARTAQLIAAAESLMIHRPGDDDFVDWCVTWLVQAVAPGDPDSAEQLAAKASDATAHVEALNAIVAAWAKRDRGRAEALADRAERIIKSKHGVRTPGSWAMSRLAQAVSLYDPDHALALAETIEDDIPRADAYGAIAQAIVGADPDQAEGLIRTIAHQGRKVMAWSALAPVAATVHPERAEQFALEISTTRDRVEALARIVRASATTDPERAERLADTAQREASAITGVTHKVWSLADITKVWLGPR